jgi:serine phosphatase RsbU (regulator of sigma subunit)
MRPQPVGTALETHVTRWISSAGHARDGGDWCDVFAISADSIALTIGDVSGHGESVSETADVLRSSIARAFRDGRGPSQILFAADTVAKGLAGGVIATAIVAILDRRLRTLTIANAGHPPPIMVTSEGHAFLSHVPGDLPLGLHQQHGALEYVIPLHATTLIALYTDGITEHERNPVKGEVELIDACRVVYGGTEQDAARCIAEHALRTVRGHDDAAVLAVRVVAGD